MRQLMIMTLLSLVFMNDGYGSLGGSDENQKEIIYVGTFSEHGSQGIYVFSYERAVKRYELMQTIFAKESPSFIATSPDGKYLFAANRGGLDEKKEWGSVSSFAIDPANGKLTLLQNQYSFGDSPCHVSVHPSGRYIFVSHYKSGNFVVFPVDENGKIGTPTANIQLKGKGTIMPRQEKPHTHSAIPSPDGRFLYVSDLGLDKILIYKFDQQTGKVTPAEQPFIRTIPGAGPRHLTFNPKGNLVFSAEEISSSICSYKVNAQTGELQQVQRLPALPPAFFGDNSSADVHTSGDGKYAYVSNRGYNGLAIFKINGSGKLKNIGYMPTIGEKPRSFLPDPQGEFMLVGNRDSNEINIFNIEKDGMLTDTSGYLPVPSPVCIIYLKLR